MNRVQQQQPNMLALRQQMLQRQLLQQQQLQGTDQLGLSQQQQVTSTQPYGADSQMAVNFAGGAGVSGASQYAASQFQVQQPPTYAAAQFVVQPGQDTSGLQFGKQTLSFGASNPFVAATQQAGGDQLDQFRNMGLNLNPMQPALPETSSVSWMG